MLTIPIATLCMIIDLARAIEGQVPPDLDDELIEEEEVGESSALEGMLSYADDSRYEQLEAIVTGLSPDERADLQALLWLGMGEYDLPDWDKASEDARAEVAGGEFVRHFIRRPLLADELLDGLDLMGIDCD